MRFGKSYEVFKVWVFIEVLKFACVGNVTKMNMMNSILPVLLLLVSMIVLQCTGYHLSDTFPKLRLIVSSIGTFNYDLACLLCDLFLLIVLMITLAKISFFVSQIKNADLCGNFLVSDDLTSLFTNISLQKTIDITINLIVNHNPNLIITKKQLFLFATSQTYFLLKVNFIIKLIE